VVVVVYEKGEEFSIGALEIAMQQVDKFSI